MNVLLPHLLNLGNSPFCSLLLWTFYIAKPFLASFAVWMSKMVSKIFVVLCTLPLRIINKPKTSNKANETLLKNHRRNKTRWIFLQCSLVNSRTHMTQICLLTNQFISSEFQQTSMNWHLGIHFWASNNLCSVMVQCTFFLDLDYANSTMFVKYKMIIK